MSSSTLLMPAAGPSRRPTWRTSRPRSCCGSSIDDYDILRRYKGVSSLPTYLTVIARRICVKEMVKRQREAELGHASAHRENAR